MLSEQQLLRYSRHIILPQIDEAGQHKLLNAKVLIIGLGGLGSPVAMYLAAAGVGHLMLADADSVERSNLQRQVIHNHKQLGNTKVYSAQAFISQLNPDIKVTAIEQRLAEKELDQAVKQVDLVIDCTDNFETRFAVNRSSLRHGKPLVSGAAIRFEGQLSVFNLTKQSACYQCLYQPDSTLDENCMDQGVLSPVVGTIGTLQATEAIKIITGAGTVLDSKLLLFDALNASFNQMAISKNPACLACG
jgi:molybdopterin-synthase adenylyltransferase